MVVYTFNTFILYTKTKLFLSKLLGFTTLLNMEADRQGK